MTPESPPLVGDDRLAARFESFQAQVGAATAAAIGRLQPRSRAAVLDIANGKAVFAGVGSPLTQAIGVALGCPIDAATFDAYTKTTYRRVLS
jgi:hypothetical protein